MPKTKYGNILQFATEDTQKASFNGTIYRKQLVKFGEWENPDYPWFSDDPKMTLDEDWGNKVKENFEAGNLGSKVPVPLNHTDDVKANTGELVALEVVAGDGLYGDLEIRDAQTIEDLDNGLIFDVSISFVWDLVRQDNGKHYGPTLLHVALVNTPYLIGMNAFEKVGAALSKLNKSFKPVGLSLNNGGAIMLSRTKVKELANVEESTIKNEKEFDVTVTYKDGDEDVSVVVKAGEEVTVPTEVAEEVTTQIADAVAPTEDEDSNSDDENKDEDANSDDSNSDENNDDKKEDEEDEDEEADKDKALAKAQLKNAEYAIKERYQALLSAGKVIPAQEAKILGLAKLGQGVQLSTESGKKIDLATVVLDILEAGNVKFSTEENGSNKEDENADNDSSNDGGANDDTDKKPSETLSEAELAGFKAVGADPAKMDELAEKDPVFREALKSLSNKYQKKGTK
jgi:hypothetical protein